VADGHRATAVPVLVLVLLVELELELHVAAADYEPVVVERAAAACKKRREEKDGKLRVIWHLSALALTCMPPRTRMKKRMKMPVTEE